MSNEYKAAYEKSGEAIKVFAAAQEAYRIAGYKVGTDAFLAARKVYDAAMAEFDAAYALEVAND
jgi:hypothetical protein